MLAYCFIVLTLEASNQAKQLSKEVKKGLLSFLKKGGKKKNLIKYLPLRNLGFSESAERETKGEKIRNKS